MKQKRKQAALGSIILGVGSILSSLIGSGINAIGQTRQAQMQADAINEQNRQNRISANQQNTSNLMNNINKLYNDNDYLNSYYDRFSNTSNPNNNQMSTLKCGGSRKMKKCGGSKKAKLGTLETIDGIGGIASNLISSIGTLNASNIMSNAKKEYYRPNNVTINAGYTGDTFKDRFPAYKCGGKKKK